jgi:hypothetical protein
MCLYENILQRVEQFLCNNSEIRDFIKPVSVKRLGEHVPAATDASAKIEELCFLCGPCRDIISKGDN